MTKLAVNQISLNKKEKHKQITSVIHVNNINTRIQTTVDPEHNAADLLWVSFFFVGLAVRRLGCSCPADELRVNFQNDSEGIVHNTPIKLFLQVN